MLSICQRQKTHFRYPRSVNDLELVSRALFGAPSQNNSTAPLPFREVELPAKLKFGFYTSGLSDMTCVLPTKRSLIPLNRQLYQGFPRMQTGGLGNR